MKMFKFANRWTVESTSVAPSTTPLSTTVHRSTRPEVPKRRTSPPVDRRRSKLVKRLKPAADLIRSLDPADEPEEDAGGEEEGEEDEGEDGEEENEADDGGLLVDLHLICILVDSVALKLFNLKMILQKMKSAKRKRRRNQRRRSVRKPRRNRSARRKKTTS